MLPGNVPCVSAKPARVATARSTRARAVVQVLLQPSASGRASTIGVSAVLRSRGSSGRHSDVR
jgi:hypothetical protein